MGLFLNSSCMSPRLMLVVVVGMVLFGMLLVDTVSAKNRCAERDRVVDVGVVLDANSKSGKQMIAAMEVACRDGASKYKLEINLQYANSDGDSGRALSLAEELIGREEVQVIVWLDARREEAMLNEISRRSSIPILSFGIGIGSGSWSLVGKHNKELDDFRQKFVKTWDYGTSEVKNFGPSITTMRAYDCMTAIARSFDGAKCGISKKKIAKVKFAGLSGPIDLGKETGLRLWLQEETGVREREGDRRRESRILEATDTKKILVPGNTPFGLFVKEGVDPMTGKKEYTGFCIDVFNAAGRLPNISGFDYEFETYDGNYSDLVEKVASNQTYDGAVGDITILAKRLEIVDFTQPFMESSLSMIVLPRTDPVKNFLFAMPFAPSMWAASGGVLLYTAFIVWTLEHGHNEEFGESLFQQISTALWFTFCSLFFAHREHIRRPLTRTVLVMWFFVALILSQSYTASLTSMLTIEKIKPSITMIESLKENCDPVGCNPASFVCDYLENVLNFTYGQIRRINDTSSYSGLIHNGNISALFLEDPYAKAFFRYHCQGFINIPLPIRFGGFGFVFKKNSSLTAPFSEAILMLSESGELSRLQSNQFAPRCLPSIDDVSNESLSLISFWGLFALTVSVSTCCVLSHLFFRKRQGYIPNNGSSNHILGMEMTRPIYRQSAFIDRELGLTSN